MKVQIYALRGSSGRTKDRMPRLARSIRPGAVPVNFGSVGETLLRGVWHGTPGFFGVLDDCEQRPPRRVGIFCVTRSPEPGIRANVVLKYKA